MVRGAGGGSAPALERAGSWLRCEVSLNWQDVGVGVCFCKFYTAFLLLMKLVTICRNNQLQASNKNEDS